MRWKKSGEIMRLLQLKWNPNSVRRNNNMKRRDKNCKLIKTLLLKRPNRSYLNYTRLILIIEIYCMPKTWIISEPYLRINNQAYEDSCKKEEKLKSQPKRLMIPVAISIVLLPKLERLIKESSKGEKLKSLEKKRCWQKRDNQQLKEEEHFKPEKKN